MCVSVFVWPSNVERESNTYFLFIFRYIETHQSTLSSLNSPRVLHLMGQQTQRAPSPYSIKQQLAERDVSPSPPTLLAQQHIVQRVYNTIRLVSKYIRGISVIIRVLLTADLVLLSEEKLKQQNGQLVLGEANQSNIGRFGDNIFVIRKFFV